MIKFASGVFEELAEITTYLAAYDEVVAQRFLEACDDSFERLAEFPEIGSSRRFEDPRLASIRMWLVKGFDNYLIFYTPVAGGVRILHVMHSSLDYRRVVDVDDLS